MSGPGSGFLPAWTKRMAATIILIIFYLPATTVLAAVVFVEWCRATDPKKDTYEWM